MLGLPLRMPLAETAALLADGLTATVLNDLHKRHELVGSDASLANNKAMDSSRSRSFDRLVAGAGADPILATRAERGTPCERPYSIHSSGNASCVELS